MKDKSPIDDLYFEIYGEYPPKAGQAYERLVAAALKLLMNKDVDYDQRMRGESDTVYQLDGLVTSDVDSSMVEAKDYTIDNKKVGRDDIQKLQGALTDLPVDKGIFASATEYTKPAKKYAISSKKNPLHKQVDLHHIRPSTTEDEKGRIKTIIITMQAHMLDYQNAKYGFMLSETTKERLKLEVSFSKPIDLRLSDILDHKGNTILTMTELTGKHSPTTTWEKGFIATGCWVTSKGHIKIGEALYPILGIEYAVPFLISESKVVIEAEGQAKLYVRSEDGAIDKLISDVDLKKAQFDKGRITLKP